MRLPVPPRRHNCFFSLLHRHTCKHCSINLLCSNGWRRIRTFEVVDNRFTVCPLWPLGNPSIKVLQLTRYLYHTLLKYAITFSSSFKYFTCHGIHCNFQNTIFHIVLCTSHIIMNFRSFHNTIHLTFHRYIGCPYRQLQYLLFI